MVGDLIADPLAGVFNLAFAIKSFIAVFVIVDAFAVVPIFLSLLENYSESDKKAMIKMAVRIAFIVLVVLTFSGNLIFQFLGIEFYSFRIAGGILLLIISIDMLFGRRTRLVSGEQEDVDKEDIAIMPMAIPLLTGPGAITTGIILFAEAGDPINELVLLINLILVFLITYQILLRLDMVYKALGHSGTKVVGRVMGIMLAAMSVQFIVEGLSEAVKAFAL
jgi:multiple antibiotic resistance protein